MRFRSPWCAAILVLASLSAVAHSQTEAPTPDPRVAELEVLKAIAEAKKAIAEAEAAATAAKFPAAAEGRGPLAGKIELSDKALYLAEWQMYAAVDALATKVAGQVSPPQATKNPKSEEKPETKTELIVTTDPGFAQSVSQARLLQASMDMWKQQLDMMQTELRASERTGADCGRLQPNVSMGGPVTANAALSGLSNIVGFFQSDYALGTSTTTPNQLAWLAAVSGKLKGTFASIRTQQFGSFGESQLITTVQGLQASSLGNRQLLATLNSWLPTKDPKKKVTDSACVAQRRGLVTRATALQDRYDSFFASITAPGEKGAPSLLERASAAGELPSDTAQILVTTIVSNGGIQSVRRNLWTSPRLAYVGGAVASYTLLSLDGRIVASGIVRDAQAMSVNVGKINRGSSFDESKQR